MGEIAETVDESGMDLHAGAVKHKSAAAVALGGLGDQRGEGVR